MTFLFASFASFAFFAILPSPFFLRMLLIR
jgi:hypothetical protein